MAGRPKASFSDEEIAEIEQYALDGCQTGTIATLTGIAYNTLDRHFGKNLTKKRAERKQKLRVNQNKLSENNPAMAIFLGKNELGQTDKIEKTAGESKVETLTPEQNKYFQEVAKEVMERMRKEKEAKQRESIKLVKGTESDSKEKTA